MLPSHRLPPCLGCGISTNLLSLVFPCARRRPRLDQNGTHRPYTNDQHGPPRAHRVPSSEPLRSLITAYVLSLSQNLLERLLGFPVMLMGTRLIIGVVNSTWRIIERRGDSLDRDPLF
jgi:hypothetical protein